VVDGCQNCHGASKVGVSTISPNPDTNDAHSPSRDVAVHLI
jgi:hypothetical protein